MFGVNQKPEPTPITDEMTVNFEPPTATLNQEISSNTSVTPMTTVNFDMKEKTGGLPAAIEIDLKDTTKIPPPSQTDLKGSTKIPSFFKMVNVDIGINTKDLSKGNPGNESQSATSVEDIKYSSSESENINVVEQQSCGDNTKRENNSAVDISGPSSSSNGNDVIPPLKRLKICRPSAKKSRPTEDSTSSSSSWCCSDSSSSDSEDEKDIRRASQAKSKALETQQIKIRGAPVEKQIMSKSLSAPPKRKKATKTVSRNTQLQIMFRKFRRGTKSTKVKPTGTPKCETKLKIAVPVQKFIPESDLEAEKSDSEKFFSEKQLTETIAKEKSPLDENWTMGSDKYLLRVVSGLHDHKDVFPRPESQPITPKQDLPEIWYSVVNPVETPRLQGRSVPVTPLILKRVMPEPERTNAISSLNERISSCEKKPAENVIRDSKFFYNCAESKFAGGKRHCGEILILPSKRLKMLAPSLKKCAKISPGGPKSSLESPSTFSEVDEENAKVSHGQLYCICRSPDDGATKMIGCDNEDCELQWFHFECVGVGIPPKGKWFCPDCRDNRMEKEMIKLKRCLEK